MGPNSSSPLRTPKWLRSSTVPQHTPGLGYPWAYCFGSARACFVAPGPEWFARWSACLPGWAGLGGCAYIAHRRAPRGPAWAGRGRAGGQNWVRFLVRPYAHRTGLGARRYPRTHPPWGIHGGIGLGRRALVFSVQVLNGTLRWAGWLGWLAGLSRPYTVSTYIHR